MTLKLSAAAAVSAMLVAVLGVGTAFAQKQGGILRAGHFDSPASMSLLEESTLAVNRPIIYYNRGGICRRPEVKELTVVVNSIYNGWRMEDVWLDK